MSSQGLEDKRVHKVHAGEQEELLAQVVVCYVSTVQ